MQVAQNLRRARSRRTVIALACSAFSLWAVPQAALAQSPEAKAGAASAQAVEQATRLFEEASARMADKRVADACELYEQSQALDPQLGTLLHLADCQEQLGKTASAYRNYLAAKALAAARAASGTPEPREAVAARRAERLQPRLAKLRLTLAAAIEGTRVFLDGQPVPADQLGAFQPIDPGQHTLQITAESYQSWSQTVAIEPATQHDIQVPRLQPLAAETTLSIVQSAPVEPSTPPATAQTSAAPSYQSIAGYISGGVGVIGLGVATYFGLRSHHFLTERDQLCPNGSCALAPPLADSVDRADSRARDYSSMFNWTVALSAVAVSAGVVLVLTAPRERKVELALGWGNLQVRGQLPE